MEMPSLPLRGHWEVRGDLCGRSRACWVLRAGEMAQLERGAMDKPSCLFFIRMQQNLRGSWPSSPPASLLLPARHVGTCRLRSARRGEDPIVELLSWQAVVVKITPPNTAPRAGCSGMTQGTEEGGTGLELRKHNWSQA